MSVATLQPGFMAWPPIVDRGAVPPLPSTPDRPRGTSRYRARRCDRGRWKDRELLLDIDPLAIPAEKRPDGEAMPEVVHPRPGVIAQASQTDLARQAPENTMDILVQQSTAALGHKKMRAAARSKVNITPFGV